MKKELIEISNKMEELNIKNEKLKNHIELYNKAKSGFMNIYTICSIFIFSLSIGTILLTYIVPSYIMGYLALLTNSISLSFLIYLISENKTNLKVMEKLNLNKIKIKLKEQEKEINSYDNEYKKIVETVMLGDDI